MIGSIPGRILIVASGLLPTNVTLLSPYTPFA